MAAAGTPVDDRAGLAISSISRASAASAGNIPHRRAQQPVAEHANRTHRSTSRRVSDAPVMRAPQRRRRRGRAAQTPSNEPRKAATSASESFCCSSEAVKRQERCHTVVLLAHGRLRKHDHAAPLSQTPPLANRFTSRRARHSTSNRSWRGPCRLWRCTRESARSET